MDVPLPELTSGPTRHPDCCLSLSTKLIDVLHGVLASALTDDRAATVLSIGSGTGLLEALLLSGLRRAAQHRRPGSPAVGVEGVEVRQAEAAPVNRYLPEQAINTVRGTWHVSPRAEDDDVGALLFAYPRLPALVSRYAELVARASSKCGVVIWLGPRADWADFEPCFRGEGAGERRLGVARILDGQDAGLVEYEIMVILEVRR